MDWAFDNHLQASLPLEALNKAVASRGGSLKDVIHHSDRGVQYACRDYALRLSQNGAFVDDANNANNANNARRLRSSNGYKPPIEFEEEFRQGQKREANQPTPVSQK